MPSGLEEPHPNTSKATSKHGQDSVDEKICPGNSAPAPPSKGRDDLLPCQNLTHACVGTRSCGYSAMLFLSLSSAQI